MKKMTPSMVEIKEALTGQNLKKTLQLKGMTKYRLAKLSGLAYSTLQSWQRDLWKPSDTKAMLVAEILNLFEPNKIQIANLKKQMLDINEKISQLETKENKEAS
jgi:transcriptional regulator with XRE-family HTH domain